MASGQDGAALREAIRAALSRLRAEARSKLPETGTFAPLRVQAPAASQGEGAIEFTIGAAIADGKTADWERKRFLEVKTLSPSGKSESSSWVFFGRGPELLEALQSEEALLEKVLAAIQEGRQHLLRHELP
ncbi:hypothetical protein F0U62_24915 [Cystobacter fuscus]|uniref:hypothetical protein n=1 Tax=Cystobacter fuscus TaxID=43 RepID=UPI002B3081EB|nr:hypothetical protein F0U62_24915 [Cystobacter fuscus]